MRQHEKAWVNRWMFLPPTLRVTSTLVRGPMATPALELLGFSIAKTFENRQLIKTDLIDGHNALECFFVKMKCLICGWTHDRIKHLKSAISIDKRH